MPAPLIATASAFANWVFEQHNRSRTYKSEISEANKRERLKLGVITHRDIDLFLHHSWTINYLGEGRTSGWSVFFVDNKERPDRIFTSSKLIVGGESLRCVPDLVLVEDKTSEILIVERKTTFVKNPYIPTTGWPNVEAQLWCYSWIDDFVSSPRVHMIGQLWSRIGSGISLCHRHPAWLRTDQIHETRCRQWFRAYGGAFKA